MMESLSIEQLQQLCNAAIRAAKQAGEYIQSVDLENVQRRFKSAGSTEASQIVTEVDIRCETIIRELLQTHSQQLDIAFIAEESSSRVFNPAAERFRKPFFWCVDPLDGTLPFVEGRPGYAVSIALLEQSGNPLIGVVYDPVDSTLVHAIKGQGAYRNMASLGKGNPSVEPASDSLIAFADSSFKSHEKYQQTVDCLNSCAQHFGLNGITLVYGSGAVKNACQVLNHSAACYLKLPKAEDGGGSIWDYAATACIVHEAGGWVSNIYGQPLELNRLGSNFMNHQGVIYASSEQIAHYLMQSVS